MYLPFWLCTRKIRIAFVSKNNKVCTWLFVINYLNFVAFWSILTLWQIDKYIWIGNVHCLYYDVMSLLLSAVYTVKMLYAFQFLCLPCSRPIKSFSQSKQLIFFNTNSFLWLSFVQILSQKIKTEFLQYYEMLYYTWQWEFFLLLLLFLLFFCYMINRNFGNQNIYMFLSVSMH